MVTCYLGIGSNLGNRKKNIKTAIKMLDGTRGIKVDKASRLFETKPVGGPPQPKFLNGALKIKTSLSPEGLLMALQDIEDKLGRVRTVKNGPRTIDLDILFFGSKIINKKNLKIPHPRLIEREFALRPLRDLIKRKGL